MRRRRFLEISGATLAGTLAGCGGGSSSNLSTGVSPLPPVPTPTPTGLDWKPLANGMQGQLILPGSANYAQSKLVFNARFNGATPAAIARCNSPVDVSAALAFAIKNSVVITPRCGGHSFAGYSTGSGLVIDVGPMNSVQLNSNGTNTATIGAGAKLADVYSQLIPQGVCIPSGTCLSVGISGVTMGGGIGVLDRQYGLTCDNLLAAQIVTADGKVLQVDAEHEPDLFWALRGGGGGNFGIATSFTFKTHTTQDLTTFNASFRYEDAIKVFQAWQAWPLSLPDSIWAQLNFSFFNPTAAPSVSIFGCCIGSQTDLAPHWANLLAAIGVSPLSTQITSSSYFDVAMGFCSGRSVSQCHFVGQTPDATIQPYSFASSSDFFDAAVPVAGIQAMLDGINSARSTGIAGQVLLDLMGGALARVAPDATAFVHRAALFSAEYFMDAAAGSNPVWSNGMRQRMQNWSSGRAYVNYLDPLIQDSKSAYYGTNYARLALVKAKYDPGRLFNLPQGV